MPKIVNPVYFESPQEAELVLRREGKKLEKIAHRVWQKYLNSYTPNEYQRSGNPARAIKLGKVKNLGVDAQGFVQYGIELTWLNNLVYHDSWLFKKGKTTRNQKGHAVMLIGTKWHSKKLEKLYKKKVYRHTYWNWDKDYSLDGNTYLDAVQREYESQKDRRVDLEIPWSGRFLQ